MSIAQQRNVADEILNSLYLIDPYAILAGGAVRDWFMNKEATDLDIFFHAPQAQTSYTMSRLLEAARFKIDAIKTDDSIPDWYKKNPDLQCIYEMTCDGIKVQLIRMYRPTFNSVVPNFPLSICDAWYKNGMSHYGKHFLRSVEHKAIYKTNEIYADEHHYIQKVLAKFPEYKYYDSFTSFAESIID